MPKVAKKKTDGAALRPDSQSRASSRGQDSKGGESPLDKILYDVKSKVEPSRGSQRVAGPEPVLIDVEIPRVQ